MKVLIVAAHPDDEVLGVGGTMHRLAKGGAAVSVLIVTEGATCQYPNDPTMIERKQNEAREANSILGVTDVRFGGLPDMRLDAVPGIQINRVIESAVQDVKPEVVFTQADHDVNADHGRVFRSTLVACRPYAAPHVKLLYSYYTPSSSEWGDRAFAGNVYYDISDGMEAKLRALAAYTSEVRPFPHPRSTQALRSTAAHFGSAVGVSFAEQFCLIRQVV